jgi:hypothetical protein
MDITIIPNENTNAPAGKLADAELHFSPKAPSRAEADRLRRVGRPRRQRGRLNVTFPSRQYSVNGERRNFALLRAVTDGAAQDRLRQLILQAYSDHQQANGAR